MSYLRLFVPCHTYSYLKIKFFDLPEYTFSRNKRMFHKYTSFITNFDNFQRAARCSSDRLSFVFFKLRHQKSNVSNGGKFKPLFRVAKKIVALILNGHVRFRIGSVPVRNSWLHYNTLLLE